MEPRKTPTRSRDEASNCQERDAQEAKRTVFELRTTLSPIVAGEATAGKTVTIVDDPSPAAPTLAAFGNFYDRFLRGPKPAWATLSIIKPVDTVWFCSMNMDYFGSVMCSPLSRLQLNIRIKNNFNCKVQATIFRAKFPFFLLKSDKNLNVIQPKFSQHISTVSNQQNDTIFRR